MAILNITLGGAGQGWNNGDRAPTMVILIQLYLQFHPRISEYSRFDWICSRI